MLSFAAVESKYEWGTGSYSVSHEREVKEKMGKIIGSVVTLQLGVCVMREDTHIALSDPFSQLHTHSIVNKC